jgi:hypothetical protein
MSSRPLVVCARVIKKIESMEEVHGVMLDELGMVMEEVTGRLEALGPGEVVRARGRVRRRLLRQRARTGSGGCSSWPWRR